jgi:hypothetical protein
MGSYLRLTSANSHVWPQLLKTMDQAVLLYPL